MSELASLPTGVKEVLTRLIQAKNAREHGRADDV